MKQSATIITFIKYLFYGITWGCTCLVLSCVCVSIFDGKEALFPVWNDFVKHAAGSVLVGIACGSTSIVYQFKQIPGPGKVLIHFLIGMGAFYPTAIYLGWFPFRPEHIGYTILQFLLSCGIFFAIWFCFYLLEWFEAKKINSKLREMKWDSR